MEFKMPHINDHDQNNSSAALETDDGYSELEALAGFDPSKQSCMDYPKIKNNSSWLNDIKASIDEDNAF